MKLWSRGLGKTELKMDCRYYMVKNDPSSDNAYIIGKIADPVNWEFRVTLEPDDIPGLIKMFLTYSIIKLTLKNMHKYITYLFTRRKYAEAAGYDIEERVDNAYRQMMNERQRPSHLRVADR